MVKCFDSAALQDPSISKCRHLLHGYCVDVLAKGLLQCWVCPHVAFPFVNPPANVTPRESIEVRGYVFYTADDKISEIKN